MTEQTTETIPKKKIRYTDKNLIMNPLLVQKLDLMVERVVKHRFDNLVLVDGSEGLGKSNLTSAIGYYLAFKSGRSFSQSNVFFLIDDMVKFAVNNEKQVIWWDEAALGGLASESYNKVQTKLLKLLMIARKKQHFYIFVIPKYFKLKESIIDRAIALLHVYSHDEITRGRFAYYSKRAKEIMFQEWRRLKFNPYKKYYTFLGTFSETLPLVLDEKEYDKKKDEAIMSLGQTDSTESRVTIKLKEDLHRIKFAYASLCEIKGLTQKILAERLGIPPSTLRGWLKLKNSPHDNKDNNQSDGVAIPIKEDIQKDDDENE